MAKDIKLYKGGSEITINETNLEHYLRLGYKQDKEVKVKPKKENKNGNTSRKRRCSYSRWNSSR